VFNRTNKDKKKNICLAGLFGLLLSSAALPAPDRTLPLPGGRPGAEEIARQVYFANHFFAFENFSIKRRGRKMAALITMDADGKLITTGVERFLNNAYEGSGVASRDLSVFRTGKLRGTGMLVTEYTDSEQSSKYSIWLPSIRKIRRFAEPELDALWGGSVFTFGDVTLRRPEHEIHELLGEKTFQTCLGVIESLEGKNYQLVDKLPKRTCRHVNKRVYGLKSTPRFEEWWYDYRISFVDTENFADYRTVYYKDGEMVKVIDRDWGVVTDSGTDDPRALFWKSWYGVDLVSGRQSWAVIPQEVIEFNTDTPSDFWSEKTLRRLKR